MNTPMKTQTETDHSISNLVEPLKTTRRLARFFSIFSLVLIAASVISQSANSGFISSNGMSLLVGLRCSQSLPTGGRAEVQLRYNVAQGAYELRRVNFLAEMVQSVQTLTGFVQCEASQFPGETVFENRCYGRNQPEGEAGESTIADSDTSVGNGPSGGHAHDTVLTIPARNRLVILWKSSLSGGSEGWLSFDKNQCEVIENHLLLPAP